MSSKSTFSSSTSKSYAVALYELSKETSEVEKVEDEIKNLYNLLKNSSDFREMIYSPIISKEDKREVLFAIADKNNFSKVLKKFLGFVASKNRLFFLGKIMQSFLNLVSTSKGELKAELISSKELSLQEKNNIQKELSKNFQSQINIDYKYDPSLIAGLIIQIGSVMIDTSIRTKLKKLEKNMIEA